MGYATKRSERERFFLIYFERVRNVISGLAGDQLKPRTKLLDWLLEGKFHKPMDLVKLPLDTFYKSMKHSL